MTRCHPSDVVLLLYPCMSSQGQKQSSGLVFLDTGNADIVACIISSLSRGGFDVELAEFADTCAPAFSTAGSSDLGKSASHSSLSYCQRSWLKGGALSHGVRMNLVLAAIGKGSSLPQASSLEPVGIRQAEALVTVPLNQIPRRVLSAGGEGGSGAL